MSDKLKKDAETKELLEEVEDIEFVFQILDEDSYDEICTLDPITVVFAQ